MKNKKATFPVGVWLGKYEAWLLTMKGSKVFRAHDRIIERFLSTFPQKKSLELFSSVDIADYIAVRESQGASNRRVYEETLVLRAFWRWLTYDQGLPVLNIKQAFEGRSEQYTVPKRAGISLISVTRLLKECSPKSREDVLKIISGKGLYPRGKQAAAIEIAARKAGLRGFTIKKLRTQVTSRLAKDIVDVYLKQVLANCEDQDLKPVPSLSDTPV